MWEIKQTGKDSVQKLIKIYSSSLDIKKGYEINSFNPELQVQHLKLRKYLYST